MRVNCQDTDGHKTEISFILRNHNPRTGQYPDPYQVYLAKHLVTQSNRKNHVNIKSMTGKMWINDRETL